MNFKEEKKTGHKPIQWFYRIFRQKSLYEVGNKAVGFKDRSNFRQCNFLVEQKILDLQVLFLLVAEYH